MFLLLPLSGAAIFVGISFYFYRGSYEAPGRPQVAVELITVPSSPVRGVAEAPVSRQGVLLVDNTHINGFDEKDINILLSRVADRGFEIEFLGRRDRRFFTSSERRKLTEEKLPGASSFAVILPGQAYQEEEMDILKRFVGKGGRLLLIGDPGRRSDINIVADGFGILFQEGYLYNVKEHELNFRNVLVKDFQPDGLTDGLAQIALYTAGSIKSSGVPLAFTDANTYSSMLERVEPFAPIVKTADGSVLAVADLTFLAPPNNTTLDNDQFISNIADFLTTGESVFDLTDFPHFFDGEIDIRLGQAGLFDLGTRIKGMLSAARISSVVRGVEDLTRDTAFLGLYQDARAVEQYLAFAGIQVADQIRTPFTPDIPAEGTAILLLHREQERWVLVVLAHGKDDLRVIVDRLESGDFMEGLVGDFLGVYQVSSDTALHQAAAP